MRKEVLGSLSGYAKGENSAAGSSSGGNQDSRGDGGMTDAAAVGVFFYPSETTKGSRAIVRALLMATVNSR